MKSSVNSKANPTLTKSWDLLPKSAKLVRPYFVPLLYVTILPTLLIQLGSTVTRGITTTHTSSGSTTSASFMAHPIYNPLSITLLTIGVVWSLLSLAAKYYVQLRAVEGKPVDVAEAYRKTAKRILPMFGLALLYSLLVVVGLLLLLVPGLIVIRRYYLAPYYLIDRNVSIREAMKLSAEATKPISGYIWGIIGVTVVLTIISGILRPIPLGAGVVLATLIDLLYIFAPAFRYKEVRQGLRAPSSKDWSTIED